MQLSIAYYHGHYFHDTPLTMSRWCVLVLKMSRYPSSLLRIKIYLKVQKQVKELLILHCTETQSQQLQLIQNCPSRYIQVNTPTIHIRQKRLLWVINLTMGNIANSAKQQLSKDRVTSLQHVLPTLVNTGW